MSKDAIEPLQPGPILREQVYEALEELIIDGSLGPGQRLVEADLARRLQVSRNPVREALSLLQRAGWVDVRPRHGTHVHRPSAKEVDDFFRVRTLLEGESAYLAALNATDRSIERLRKLYDQGVKALLAGDERRMADTNSTFHNQITEMADNLVLSEILDLLKKRLRWYFARVAKVRGPASWEEHAMLLDALAEQQADRAADVMRRHSEATWAIYRETRDDHGG